MEKDLKAKLIKWVEHLGYPEAEKRLVMAGVSASTAQKLARGKYPNQPKRLILQAIEVALSQK